MFIVTHLPVKTLEIHHLISSQSSNFRVVWEGYKWEFLLNLRMTKHLPNSVHSSFSSKMWNFEIICLSIHHQARVRV